MPGLSAASATELPPTATAAVIVPVMDRPQNVAPLVRSLRATTDRARAYFVCDADDLAERAAVERAGAARILNHSAERTFAVKANLGVRATTEPWVLLVGDDVTFRSGWLEAALAAAGDRFALVSTNDTLSEVVSSGQLATHPLIRRCWIEEHGASWDGPGTVAHEGYRHWYVDNEWSAVAHAAGTFVYAEGAVVEHRHPHWGTAPDDPVYRVGRAAAEADARIWERRSAEHLARPAPRWPADLDQATGVDLIESLASARAGRRAHVDLDEVEPDLARLGAVVTAARPDRVVLLGGQPRLAAWLAEHGPSVVNVSATPPGTRWDHPRVSTTPDWPRDTSAGSEVLAVVSTGRESYAGGDLATAIASCEGLVPSGGHLLVRGGARQLLASGETTEPLREIARALGSGAWERDLQLEGSHSVTHHLAGWLRRT